MASVTAVSCRAWGKGKGDHRLRVSYAGMEWVEERGPGVDAISDPLDTTCRALEAAPYRWSSSPSFTL